MNTYFTLFLGFFLGISHALETDHIIAVSTIVSQNKNPWRSAIIGAFWGIGHTTTLFFTGLIVLLLKIRIPTDLSALFEAIAGLLLITLGARALRKDTVGLHEHKHIHGDKSHSHIHPHSKHKSALHTHHTSFMVGLVHGLAGSGALMILVLSTVSSVTQSLYYILLFGVGSVAGMSVMSFLVSLPFTYASKRFPTIEKNLRIVAATLSIIFGISIVYRILSVTFF